MSEASCITRGDVGRRRRVSSLAASLAVETTDGSVVKLTDGPVCVFDAVRASGDLSAG